MQFFFLFNIILIIKIYLYSISIENVMFFCEKRKVLVENMGKYGILTTGEIS